jgi:hypothetical protein
MEKLKNVVSKEKKMKLKNKRRILNNGEIGRKGTSN